MIRELSFKPQDQEVLSKLLPVLIFLLFNIEIPTYIAKFFLHDGKAAKVPSASVRNDALKSEKHCI